MQTVKQEVKIMYKKTFKEKTKSFFKEKGFYLVCCACLVAIGMAAWSAASPITVNEVSSKDPGAGASSIIDTPSDTTTEDNVSNTTAVDKPESNVPKVSSLPESTPESTVSTAPEAKYFVMPVTGNIVKGFNNELLQYSETFRDMRIHSGIDVVCEKGTAVYSSGDGTVVFVGKDSMLGNIVKIDHGNNVLGVYCGLNSKMPVKEGDVVNSKTQIGIVDEIPSESVEQTHFHFEVYEDGIAVSPLKVLGME